MLAILRLENGQLTAPWHAASRQVVRTACFFMSLMMHVVTRTFLNKFMEIYSARGFIGYYNNNKM